MKYTPQHIHGSPVIMDEQTTTLQLVVTSKKGRCDKVTPIIKDSKEEVHNKPYEDTSLYRKIIDTN